MAADAVISRELESLHQEVSASQRERPMPHVKPDPTSREAGAQTIPLEDPAPRQITDFQPASVGPPTAQSQERGGTSRKRFPYLARSAVNLSAGVQEVRRENAQA